MRKFILPVFAVLFFTQVSIAESQDCKLAKVSEQTINNCAWMADKYKDLTDSCDVIADVYHDYIVKGFKVKGDSHSITVFETLWKSGLSNVCKTGCKSVLEDGTSLENVRKASALMRKEICERKQ